ncbi:hypothetical protein B0H66DRAFT_47205 [Apodospora peruviana]|uniref:Uncharacterized protein n=1 Tax=Apodospora peruviana TaxID=516989 RepID=A0AAE0IS01_9PEZI|nr:hypothetical protein B0H66DRAFT_47205 [Apodospora peruviana]
MSFCVAVRSAVFYFVACTPCAKIRHRHRAAQKAEKERETKARIVIEQPHLYQHPDPFNTNPYWGEEIQMGPALQRKGRVGGSSSKNNSQRGLTAVSRDGGGSIGTGSSQLFSTTPGAGTSPSPVPNCASSPTNTSTRIGSGPTIVAEEDGVSHTLSKTASVSTGDDWNLKRYQREDEELWGTWTGQKLMDAIKQAGSTAGRFVESKLGIEKPVTEEDRYNFYFLPRNPPVNDFHPPVVSSKPIHKDALQWMLQPPPPAKVMEGKIPVSRSPSMMSAGSRRTATTVDGQQTLGRRVGGRAIEARLRNGETPSEGDLYSTASVNRTRSRRAATAATTRTRSRRTARSRSFSTEESGDSSEGFTHSRRRPSYRVAVTPEVESGDEDAHVPKGLEPLSKSNAAIISGQGRAAQRPRLSTIMSSETATENTVSSSVPRAEGSSSTDMSSLSPPQENTSSSSVSPVESDLPKEQKQAMSAIDDKLALSA